MTYIIDPMWFYLINVLSNLGGIGVIALIIGVLATGGLAIFMGYFYTNEYDEKYAKDVQVMKLTKKFLTIAIIVLIIGLLCLIFAPNETTCYAMLAAKIATVENVEWTVEGFKEVVDYIVDSVAVFTGDAPAVTE